jgi:putative DNA primase/helicase
MTHPVSGEPVGIHRTFIDVEGAKMDRKMLGQQGVIRLSPDDAVTMSLGIAEGIEDGMAVLLSGWAPVWSATSAGAIARFPVLLGIESLTVFADADKAGMQSAETCRERWIDANREVAIVAPRRLK